MTRTAWIVLALGALALTSCRSDGGFGRADSQRGLSWSADRVAHRFELEVERTGENLEALGSWLGDEVTDPLHEMSRSWSLYTEGTAGYHEH